MTDHTHSDYADGFDAGVEAGAQQFRDFLAKHAPVYVKDIQQWHRDFLAARNARVAEVPAPNGALLSWARELLEAMDAFPTSSDADERLKAQAWGRIAKAKVRIRELIDAADGVTRLDPVSTAESFDGITGRPHSSGVAASDKVQMPDKARAGIEVLHCVIESLLTTSRYVDEEGEATQALADLSDCIADPPFKLATGVKASDGKVAE